MQGTAQSYLPWVTVTTSTAIQSQENSTLFDPVPAGNDQIDLEYEDLADLTLQCGRKGDSTSFVKYENWGSMPKSNGLMGNE
jgi:hypothetical protein